jgi:hypothetical protein
MSKSKTIYNEHWSGFSETRDVWPFEKKDDALAACRLRTSADKDFASDEVLQIAENAVSDDPTFAPELEIVVDRRQLTDVSHLKDHQIAIVANLSDIATKRSHQLSRHLLRDISEPETILIDGALIKKLSGLRGFSVSIVAVSQVSNAVYDIGDRIAEKDFQLAAPSEMSFSFPIGKIDPDSDAWPFDRYPKTTAWFIQWGESNNVFDFDARTEEVLTVIFNEKVYNNLFHLQKQTDASHRLFWSGLSIDVFLEVASVYLNVEDTAEPAKDQAGFRAKFVRSLQEQWRGAAGGKILSYAELAKEYKNDCSFISRLRALLQDKFGVRKLSDRIHKGE